MKAYSVDDENYTTDEDEVLNEVENNNSKIIYVGDKVNVYHKDMLSIGWLIDDMQQRAYDDSEYGEDYLEGIDKDKLSELEKVILDFMNKNFEQPRWFKVENIEKISVDTFKEKILLIV
jgi:hypothetical protein